ncbi:hypothetical protein O181_006254 [Austropuccinia psidii MF-1]|uniref:Uncharacterized protein n=1 Tax=Austropuccinia psidii MF-1 TaxID=1389203 RepID=A0A9Q3GGP1_9BASI|nr:hypothetical protein [Austropuccinia psidii MF-1]
MWKNACDTAAKCIAEEKEYNKQMWDKSHIQTDFKEGDQVKNAVEVKLTEEFLRKYPFFPVSLVTHTSRQRKKILLQEEKPHPTKDSGSGRLPWARKIRLNGKDQRQYLVRFQNQTADKEKWLAENAIPDENLHLRRLRASRRA